MTSQIDTTGLTRIGNMTTPNGGGSSGLDNIFDGSNTTSGYTNATSGWAGVQLSAATAINKAQFDPQTNGFDASGSTTSITIKLYGKTGATAPSGPTDGTLLGTLTFTDVNSLTTREITSSDQATLYSFVWGYVTTGVWSVFTEARFYTNDAYPVTEITDANEWMLTTSCNQLVALPRAGMEIPQFRIRVKLNETRNIMLLFHSDSVYNTVNSYDDVTAFSFRVTHRSAATEVGLDTASYDYDANACGGGNILNLHHHYGNTAWHKPIAYAANYHEFSIWGYSGTTLNSYDGIASVLAEGSPANEGRNCFTLMVKPTTCTLIDVNTL